MCAISRDSVVVSDLSYSNDEPCDLVGSNIDFLNALFAEYLEPDEVSTDGLCSYYVDYYMSQVNNGGFSQFVYNSQWRENLNELVCQGLRAMNAVQHLDIFENGMYLVGSAGSDELELYLASEYFGENSFRDQLDTLNDRFFDVSKSENLTKLNAAWLRQLPNLVVLSESEMQQEIARRANAVPDREQRIAKARAKEPRYLKLIRLLCEKAGHTLSHITAGNPAHDYNGEKVTAWHFVTDQGHFHMIEVNGKGIKDKALMFRGHSTTDKIFELETSPCMPLTSFELAERKKEWNDWMAEEREGLGEFVAQQFPGKTDVELDIATVFKYALWKKGRDESCESGSG